MFTKYDDFHIQFAKMLGKCIYRSDLAIGSMTAKPSAKVACIQIPLKISTAFFERGSMDNRLCEKMANRMNGFKSY